jgi:hypothetical protein
MVRLYPGKMGRTMERNRWETAIRCLEIAVHPHTAEEEVIAAVNGFRRTANGTPLIRVCREFAGLAPPASSAELDRLRRENLELRRKFEEAENGRVAALRRAEAAEQNARAAEHRADAAEERLAEFQGAYGRISGGLSHENADLRRALAEARRNLAQPIHEPVRPFQNMLNTALGRPDQTPSTPALSHPWTA